MSAFDKKCSNCIHCTIYNYGYCNEMYCDAECKYNDGSEIIDEKMNAFKCSWFKNKHIRETSKGCFEIIDTHYSGTKVKPIEICCFSSNVNVLEGFLAKPSNLHIANKLITQNSNDLKNFIEFFKNELPDVYKRMWKEYCKCKNNTEYCCENDDRFDELGNSLRKGECQRKDGRYMYRWTVNGKEKTVYALTLDDLRDKERRLKINDSR